MEIEIELQGWYIDFLFAVKWWLQGKCIKHGTDFITHGYYDEKRCLECFNENRRKFLTHE